MGKKFKYLVVLQQNWGYGWDDIAYEDDSKDGRRKINIDFRCYLKNEPQVPLRIIHRREPVLD